jgi:hypothetical protein
LSRVPTGVSERTEAPVNTSSPSGHCELSNTSKVTGPVAGAVQRYHTPS